MSDSQSTVEYRDIQGFPGYRVGDDGSVWSRFTQKGAPKGTWRLGDRWRPLRPGRRQDGAFAVTLVPGNVSRFVHHLVLEAFVGPRPDGMECCHNDGNASNNRRCNLRWDTHRSNMQDCLRHGTHKPPAKLTSAQVKEIRQRHSSLPKRGGTAILAEEFSVSRITIYQIVTRRTWKNL